MTLRSLLSFALAVAIATGLVATLGDSASAQQQPK